MSGTIYPVTQYHISRDLNVRNHLPSDTVSHLTRFECEEPFTQWHSITSHKIWMSGTIYPVTQYHISQDLNVRNHLPSDTVSHLTRFECWKPVILNVQFSQTLKFRLLCSKYSSVVHPCLVPYMSYLCCDCSREGTKLSKLLRCDLQVL